MDKDYKSSIDRIKTVVAVVRYISSGDFSSDICSEVKSYIKSIVNVSAIGYDTVL